MSESQDQQIAKRRTFAIISHPDAGKTTLTEKLLFLGGAINMAGTVKAKKSQLHARSDWMEIEKKRGISVTSSVLKFAYAGYEVNLIDTPGHQDFSEDTYRTLTAVDSVIMLIDAASGVEEQTKKLFAVCRMRKTPVMAFINKMDRDGHDGFHLLSEIEDVLGIACFPMTWPTGSGRDFVAVYDRMVEKMSFVEPHQTLDLDLQQALYEDLEMLEGAGEPYSQQAYLRGELAPVFFGSAITGFGVKTMLEALLKIAPPPGPRQARERLVRATEPAFTAFIFKIQANMDPSHRDRVAFMRICSGVFTRNMKVYAVRSDREFRLGRPTKFVAKDRSLVDKAYPGDIVGIHDPGIFAIGDTLTQGEKLHFEGIPVFAPEHFATLTLKDPLRSKQLNKGLDQLSEEGAVQVFRKADSRQIDVGVVGILQFDVVKFRLKAEYGVEVIWQRLPASAARWVVAKSPKDLDEFITEQPGQIYHDRLERPVVLADRQWQIDLWQKRYPAIDFIDTASLFQS